MGKYKVLPITMSLKNNQIANHGDIVDDSQLNSSPYDLKKGNFIRDLTEDELNEIEEYFEDAEIVDDPELTQEEKDALVQKEKEDQEAADLKKKQEEEAASEKLRLEEEEKAATSNLSAKDKAKEFLTKK